MNFLPYEHIVYKTHLSKEEILRRLEEIVEPKKVRFLWKNKPTKKFEGTIEPERFNINRIIKGRNSYLPQIKGKIISEENSTLIDIKMNLHWSVIVFLFLWCTPILIEILQVDKNSSINLIPLVLLLFMYGLTMFSFKSESLKTVENFKELFEAY